MKLLYDTNQFFLGIVKFYDKKKHFGYISSNNLGMNRGAYDQDFYINKESFDSGIVDEGSVVVFQLAQFGAEDGMKGRVQCRAINVRSFSKTDDDFQLLLSYYGSHEIVRVKEKSQNLFKLIAAPRSIILQKLISDIEESDSRTMEKTLEAFKHVVEFYKQESFRGNYTYIEYIFDRDYNRKSKESWLSFINRLTEKEVCLIVKTYPSVIRYILKQDVLLSSFNSMLEDSVNNDSKLWYLNRIINSCSPEIQELLVPIFQSKVDVRFNQILSKVEDHSIPSEQSFINECEVFLLINNSRYYPQHKEALYRLRKRQFLVDVAKLQDEKDCSLLSTVQKEYDLLSDEDKLENKDLFNNGKDSVLSGLLSAIEASLDKPEELMILLEHKYETETRPYISEEEELSFTNQIKTLLPRVQSIFALDKLSRLSWIPRESCIEQAKGLIRNWDFDTMRVFLPGAADCFRKQEDFRSFLVKRAIPLTQEAMSAGSFSLEQDLAADGFYNHSIIKVIHSLISPDDTISLWNDFISSLDDASVFLIFRKGLIETIPEKTIQWAAKSLTINDFDGNPADWYSPPRLKSDVYDRLFREFKGNLVEVLLPVLIKQPSNSNIIPLCFCLAELMAYNRPKDEANYLRKTNWERHFYDSLKGLVSTTPMDSRIKNVLWATYFETTGVSRELKDSFSAYPPYYQIRIVRKLFQLVSLNKLKLSVKDIYNLLGGGEHSICLPLVISFKYLILREENPTSTLQNEHLVSILHGRPDNEQWYELARLMTPCVERHSLVWLPPKETGRFRTESFSLYNGIVKYEHSQLRLLIYNKMVDSSGEESKYNNKLLSTIKDYIQISFAETEYSCTGSERVSEYCFSECFENDVLLLCDSFNIYYPQIRVRKDSPYAIKKEGEKKVFCECRLADKIDEKGVRLFYWCDNKPCFRPSHLRFRTTSEWEDYTLLDFMRIAKIPVHYTNKNGKTTRFGYYILLSAFLYRFVDFYEHMKCRECNRLMSPVEVSNYGAYAATQFICNNKDCPEIEKPEKERIVYLNHCFNRNTCGATIDSRDSQQCPNRQYICPQCGGCCSTENATRKIEQLKYTGGTISQRLLEIATMNLGHWENNEVYCYKCGKKLPFGTLKCIDCGVEYKRKQRNSTL